MNQTDSLRKTVYASLMAALIAMGSYIAIPIGPVPIVLQSLFILLAGLLLGARWGLISVSVYLLAGACGLPVFAGGTGGLAKFAGPTGGYLIGYIPAVLAIGAISHMKENSIVTDVLAMVAGTAILYFFGVSWLKIATNLTLVKTLGMGMFPFLPGDVLKIIAAIPIAKSLRPAIGFTRLAHDHS